MIASKMPAASPAIQSWQPSNPVLAAQQSTPGSSSSYEYKAVSTTTRYNYSLLLATTDTTPSHFLLLTATPSFSQLLATTHLFSLPLPTTPYYSLHYAEYRSQLLAVYTP